MSIRVSSWNIEARLSPLSIGERGSPEKIVENIARLNADVLTLPEAYDASLGVSEEINDALENLGYGFIDTKYNDGGERFYGASEAPTFRILSRLAISNSEVIRFGGLRDLRSIVVNDPETGVPTTILGVHMDDRSELFRQRQMADFIDWYADRTDPVVAMGDWNSMHKETTRAKLLGSKAAESIVRLIPIGRLRHYGTLLNEMASGKTLMVAEALGLRDADPTFQATMTPKMRGNEWVPSVRLTDLDHIYVSDEITATDFEVMKKDGGSDHRAISATLHIQN